VFTAYHSGQKTTLKAFSYNDFSLDFDEYVDNIKKLTKHHWDNILEHADVLKIQPKEEGMATSLSKNCHNLYMPSSPMESSDDE
jgi:hypothetical protein